jgi:hypothetical protein
MTTFDPVALYELAKRLHPEGVVGTEFIPVEVQGMKMELRYFTDRGKGLDVEFSFFRTDAKYSRRAVIVWSDGRMEPDDEGVIPEFDQRDGEAPITLTVEELMRIAFDSLQKV